MRAIQFISILFVALGVWFQGHAFLLYQSAGSQGSIFPEGNEVTLLSHGYTFKFLEGPAWSGSLLYFTDIQGNSIYCFDGDTIQAINTQSNLSNGLLFHRNKGYLLVCVGGAGHLATLSPKGNFIDTLVAEYNGKPFNSPNDLIRDSQGGIYFTDPTWAAEYPQPHKGVYYLSGNNTTKLLISDLDKPNGIILSPDQQVLYVNDSHSPSILAFDVVSPGLIANRRVFATLDMGDIQGNISGADGMAMDIEGNLFVTFRRGVQVFSPSGETLALIPMPETATNCTFGGQGMDILFITAGKNLYSIQTDTKGVVW